MEKSVYVPMPRRVRDALYRLQKKYPSRTRMAILEALIAEDCRKKGVRGPK